jgi:beta-1,2-mannobiose phosphorylase / 1,2-beta-oligomannan phosphorylase
VLETTATSSDSPPVRRLRAHPIVEPGAVVGYGALFNAGVLHHAGAYHLFVRAVRDGYRVGDGTGPRFVDYVSDIVVFTSTDGHEYEYGYVLAAAGVGGMECVEDPRVQWVHHAGDPHLVMTYTHLPMSGTGPWRIGAHRLRWSDERFELDGPSGRLLGPRDIANKDAVVFTLDDGRVALIHRIHPDMQLAIFEDLEHLWHAPATYWDSHVADLASHTLLTPSPGALGIGAGAPPVRTEAGFLLFFHERRADGAYTMNVALLDSATGQLVSRLPEPVLEPELDWERTGDVDEVVFVQGAHLDGDEVYLTYGAADRCVGAAVASVPHLLDLLAEVVDDRAA